MTRSAQSTHFSVASITSLLAVLEEKYWATRRELETLRQRIHSEHEDEIEKLQTAKKTLEKKVGVSRCGGACLIIITVSSF